jgi:hypothetical protein
VSQMCALPNDSAARGTAEIREPSGVALQPAIVR